MVMSKIQAAKERRERGRFCRKKTGDFTRSI